MSKLNKKVREIRRKSLPVLEKYGVEKAALFGSVARREEGPESDIDILVVLPEGSTLLDLAGLQIELTKSLGGKTDVITYRSIHPRLKNYILSDEIKIYEKGS